MAIAGGRVLLCANNRCLGKIEPPGKRHVLGWDGALEGVSWSGGWMRHIASGLAEGARAVGQGQGLAQRPGSMKAGGEDEMWAMMLAWPKP